MMFLVPASFVVRADEEQSAKEGFKEAHQGMKKAVTSVDKKGKKD
jgi:hypothetical protein